MDNCLFCKINRNEIPSDKVFENDELFAIRDINPQAPTHILIIPKKHHATLLDLESEDKALIGEIHLTAGKIARNEKIDKSGFRLLVNCGAGAGQTVFHIHFHLLGGRPMSWPPG